MTTNAEPDSRSVSRKRRIHLRTILLVGLIVLLPWTLLSIPGDAIGGGSDLATHNVSNCQHGWPFVHMHSTRYELFGYSGNNGSDQDDPTQVDTKALAIESFNEFFRSPEHHPHPLEFDLRLERSKWGTEGHWSIPNRWTLWDDEHYFEIRWPGLIANLILVSVVAVMIGWPIEKKFRNGKLFKFSLLSIGVVVAISCVALAWAMQTYTAFQSEQTHVRKLRQLDNNDSLFGAHIEYNERFPRVISQLFNGGYTPWGNFGFFKKVSKANVDAYIDDLLDKAEMDNAISALESLDQGEFLLDVDVMGYTELTEQLLNQLDAYRIVSLHLRYDAHEWHWKQAGGDGDDISQQKAAIAVNLNLKLPNIEVLTIELQDFFTAKEQLEPFLNLPPQTQVLIKGLDDDAVKYVLETQDCWPDGARFSWFVDDVGAELREKMMQRFPGSEETERVHKLFEILRHRLPRPNVPRCSTGTFHRAETVAFRRRSDRH